MSSEGDSRRSQLSSGVTRVIVLASLLAIALIPLMPAICAAGFPSHHEGRRYEVLTTLFADAIAHGSLYPRWLPDLAGGRGYPTFLLYQPLFFYVASAVRLLPLTTLATSSYVADALFSLVGVIGAYRLARAELAGTCGRLLSLCVALLFACTPYVYTNLFVRGDHSEFAAMMLTPWPLVALRAIERRLRGDRHTPPLFLMTVVGGDAIALIVYAHPAVSLLYAPILAALVLGTAATIGKQMRGCWLAMATVMAIGALLASSPYWFVVWQSAPDVHLERLTQGQFHPTVNAVPPAEIFLGRGGLAGAGVPGSGTFTPSPLGLPQAILAVFGVVMSITSRRSRDVRTIVLGSLYIALVLLMTPLARTLWSIQSPLTIVQFPFRLLSVLAAIQMTLVIQALALLPRRSAIFVAAATCVAVGVWHAPMFHARPVEIAATPDAPSHVLSWAEVAREIDAETRQLPFHDVTFALMGEFDPKWRQIIGAIRGSDPFFVANVPMKTDPQSTEYRAAASFDGGTAGGATIVRQLFFPGWRVEINDVAVADEWLEANVRDDGQMVVKLPPGQGRIVAFYDGPPGWRLRTVVVSAALFGLLAWLWRFTRHAENAAFLTE